MREGAAGRRGRAVLSAVGSGCWGVRSLVFIGLSGVRWKQELPARVMVWVQNLEGSKSIDKEASVLYSDTHIAPE